MRLTSQAYDNGGFTFASMLSKTTWPWVAATAVALSCAVAARAEPLALRWVYLQANLADPTSVDVAVKVIERAGAAGLNGVVLADSKFMVLERYGYARPDQPYHRNVMRLRQVASRHGMQIIPHIPVVSGAQGLFAHDPNLAEGFEVRDSTFVVRDGVADVLPGQHGALADGGFENAMDGRFASWAYQDDPGRAVSPDRSVVRSGRQSARLEPRLASRNGLCRLHQKIRVQPRRCYRLSVWVRTEALEPISVFKISATGVSPEGDRPLVLQQFEVKPTQGWQQIHAVFNSLTFREINVHAGLWGGRSGKVWLDDFELAEVGLVNVLRRPGCPLTVRSEDGETAYVEGDDFAPVADALLGRPRDWPGMFSRFHRAPVLRMRKRLPDGTRLKVSYYHPLMDKVSKVDACMTEPKSDAIFERQVSLVNHLFGSPQRYMLGYNEIRAAGSCAACKATGKTPGQILADHVRRTVAIMERIRPGVELTTWQDMFDPSANAIDAYYLVEGTMAGSWDGLPESMTIVNWTEGDRKASLDFFSGRGHPQVISIDFDRVKDAQVATRAGVAALRQAGGGAGLMYTTWVGLYDDLEAFAGVVRGDREGQQGH